MRDPFRQSNKLVARVKKKKKAFYVEFIRVLLILMRRSSKICQLCRLGEHDRALIFLYSRDVDGWTAKKCVDLYFKSTRGSRISIKNSVPNVSHF